MPIYEYECLTCGTTFEKRQSFSEEPVANCPQGHSDTRRILSAPAIVFKGSGFYINDSRSSKNGINTSSSSSSKTDSGSDTKTETKTEAKTETKAESKAAS